MWRKLARRLAEAAATLAVALALYVASTHTSRGSWDDLAVLRAAAWLGTCKPTDPLPVRIREHLEERASSLSSIQLSRYRLRTEFSSNYGLIAPVVRGLERQGHTPLLANVIQACRLQHLAILLVVCALGWWSRSWLFLALLFPALLLTLPLPGELVSWLPFQRHSMTWAASAPRGAAVLAWFGAVAAWLMLRGAKRWSVALGLLLASALCHRSMAILCFAATIPTLGLWALLRLYGRWRPSASIWAAAFFALTLVAAAGKIGLLWHHEGHLPTLFTLSGKGGRAEVIEGAFQLAAWTAMIVAALALWLGTRRHLAAHDSSGSTAIVDESLCSAGDGLAILLAATAAVGLGLNAAHPTSELWYRSLFFVAEASMRLGALPQLLFYALLAVIAVARVPRLVTPTLLGGAAAGLLLAGVQLRRVEPPQLPEPAQSLTQLLRRREKAYDNEVQYYLSVASEVAQHGCERP